MKLWNLLNVKWFVTCNLSLLHPHSIGELHVLNSWFQNRTEVQVWNIVKLNGSSRAFSKFDKFGSVSRQQTLLTAQCSLPARPSRSTVGISAARCSKICPNCQKVRQPQEAHQANTRSVDCVYLVFTLYFAQYLVFYQNQKLSAAVTQSTISTS